MASFAKMAQSEPRMSPTPVTRPADGSCSSYTSNPASCPISKNGDCTSRRASMRSRAGNLPRAPVLGDRTARVPRERTSVARPQLAREFPCMPVSFARGYRGRVVAVRSMTGMGRTYCRFGGSCAEGEYERSRCCSDQCDDCRPHAFIGCERSDYRGDAGNSLLYESAVRDAAMAPPSAKCVTADAAEFGEEKRLPKCQCDVSEQEDREQRRGTEWGIPAEHEDEAGKQHAQRTSTHQLL